MPDTIDQTPAAGTGGLDGDFDGGPDDGGADEALEPGMMTPQGPVESFDDDEADGGDGDDGEGDDWTSALPEDLREKFSSKGFKSPADLARAYSEAEQRVGEFRGEIGALRDEIANLASRQDSGYDDRGQGQQQQQQQAPSLGDVAAYAKDIAARVDQGDVDVGAGMAAVMEAYSTVASLREQEIEARFEQRLSEALDERTGPLEAEAYTTSVGREIQAIKREIGPDAYSDFAKPASEILERWETTEPGFVRNPRAIRAAFNEAIARNYAQSRRESEGRVLDRTGGRGARRGPSPAELVIREMDELSGPGSSGGL